MEDVLNVTPNEVLIEGANTPEAGNVKGKVLKFTLFGLAAAAAVVIGGMLIVRKINKKKNSSNENTEVTEETEEN